MISDKGVFGLFSGILTTSLLQPFQNIKMAIMIPPKVLKKRMDNNFINNFKLASQFILKQNGYKGFYKGLVAATMKAGIGCYIYFSFLRYFQKQEQSAFKNFLISSFARILSACMTNPLSIVQTRFQLADFHMYTSVYGAIKDIYKKQGIKGFFSGCLASCIKQGFFAGLYYMFYEKLKQKEFNRFSSGILSGMVSTSISHPLQIIRARLQTLGLKQNPSPKQHLIYKQLCILYRNGQWLKGLTPRLIKKPLANTMTFFIFQIIQERKAKNNQ